MPWVLQGTAPRDDSEWLMHHLAHCEPCSIEFAQQSQLRCALSLPTDVPVDVEAGLKHLLERLDASEPETPLWRLWSSGNRLTRALAVAVVVQAIGIGMLGAWMWKDATPQPQYRTLSQPAPVAPTGAIRVVPTASITVSDWNHLLHNLGLRVVDGPNDMGAYTVVANGSPARSARLLQELRASRSIHFAEPVGSLP
jgi:hypothetical protein